MYNYSKNKGKSSDILKIYGVTHQMIADWFSYSNVLSLDNSSAKDRIIEGVRQAIQYAIDEAQNKLTK